MAQPDQKQADNKKLENMLIAQDLPSKLRANKTLILKKWQEEIVRLIPAAQTMSSHALRDSLPILLDRLADSLGDTEHHQSQLKEGFILGVKHGEERSEMAFYDLYQVIEEYQILKKAIFEVLRKDHSLSEADQDMINDSFDIGIRNAVSSFMELHKQKDQASHRLLQENELRLQAIVEGIKDHAIIRTNKNGIIVDWNSGAEKITGFTREEAIGKSGSIIFTPEDLAHGEDKREMQAARNVGKAEDNRWHVKKDGSRFFVTGAMNPLFLEDGELVGYIKVFRDSTHLQLANEERDIFFAVPNILLCITDARTHRFIRVTPAWENILGYSREELEGQPVFNFIHPDDLNRTAREAESNTKGSPSVGFQNRFRTKSGEYKWLQWNVSLVAETAYCAVQDITFHKIEEERRTEKARLLDLTKDAVIIRDQEDRILYWNHGAETIYGYLRSEALGKSSHDLLKTQFVSSPQDIQNSFTQKGAWAGELKHQCKNGQTITVASRWVLDKRESGAIRILETNTDISERKEAEIALQESYKTIREMVDTLPVLFWWTDKGGKGNHFNKKWYEYTGLSDVYDSSSSENFHEMIHPDDLQNNLKAREEAVRLKKPAKFEERIRRFDGEYRWHLVNATPILDENGNLIRWYANSTDIHEQKMSELEKSLKAQTLQAETENLSSRNRELDRFAAIAAHDLKSPLNSITQFTELLADQYRDQLGPDANDYIDFIVNAGNRMRGLIDNLLEFARSGTIDRSKLQPVEIATILATVQKNLTAEINRTKATLSIPPDLPVVLGLEPQLVQLFQNLIANAIKFRKPHLPPQISITYSSTKKNCWEFAVNDQGIGINPIETNKIFEIFGKLHSSSQYEGSGIGLAVCKRIVEALGGKIWLESTPGEGSTFFFTLPKAES